MDVAFHTLPRLSQICVCEQPEDMHHFLDWLLGHGAYGHQTGALPAYGVEFPLFGCVFGVCVKREPPIVGRRHLVGQNGPLQGRNIVAAWTTGRQHALVYHEPVGALEPPSSGVAVQHVYYAMLGHVMHLRSCQAVYGLILVCTGRTYPSVSWYRLQASQMRVVDPPCLVVCP